MNLDLVESGREFGDDLAVAFFTAIVVLSDAVAFVADDRANGILVSVGFEMDRAGIGKEEPLGKTALLEEGMLFVGGCGEGKCAGL